MAGSGSVGWHATRSGNSRKVGRGGELTGLSTHSDPWTREPESRHCISPEGHLLTWYAALDGGVASRSMYRFRSQPIDDAEGEALRVEWGGARD